MKVIQLFKNENRLIRLAAEKNRDAQEQLYRSHSAKMLSICRMYIKDLHHAEDVMLSGFLKVFTHIGQFRNEGSFEGWMRKIMVRESISFLRTQKNLEISEEIQERDAGDLNNIQAGIDVEHIQQLIDALPEGYKVVFVMYAIEGYKHKEISEILNISEGTSKSQLFKARMLLQEKIKNQKNSEYGTAKI